MGADRPFWSRWGARNILGWSLGIAALAALTWAIAATAQHAAVVAARPETADLYTYSLGGHVAGMSLLGCVAVLVASDLAHRRCRWTAVVVLAATAAGPMSLIAAPIRANLIAPTSMDTVWWWHLIVALAVFAILTAWTVAVVSRVPASDAVSRGRVTLSDEALFVLAAAVAFAGCWNHAWHMQESPGALPALGWAALAAGSLLVSLRGRLRVSAILLPLVALTLGALAWAYLREGGWPGVAGWEFNGMESPVILSAQVAVVTAGGPLIAMTLRAVRHLLSRDASRATIDNAVSPA